MINLQICHYSLAVRIIYGNAIHTGQIPRNFPITILMKGLQNWIFYGLYTNNILIGVLSLHNGTAHIDIIPQWQGKWASRSIWKACLDKAFHHFPIIETHSPTEFRAAHRLIQGVGFKEIRRTNKKIYYRLHQADRKY